MMTRDDIIRMASEAGFQEGWLNLWATNFERFAALVADAERAARIAAQTEVAELKERLARSGVEHQRAVREAVLAEREACAQVTKAISDKYAIGCYGNEVDTADEIEAAIRARGAA